MDNIKNRQFYIKKIKKLFELIDSDDSENANKELDELKKDYEIIEDDLFGVLVRIESFLLKSENISLNDIKSEFNSVLNN
ncbi:hypothetical protein KKH36_02615 [Patescibacteria group bacterium]|nr:hypothetical protein [Patescibacteria group bacterium]